MSTNALELARVSEGKRCHTHAADERRPPLTSSGLFLLLSRSTGTSIHGRSSVHFAVSLSRRALRCAPTEPLSSLADTRHRPFIVIGCAGSASLPHSSGVIACDRLPGGRSSDRRRPQISRGFRKRDIRSFSPSRKQVAFEGDVDTQVASTRPARACRSWPWSGPTGRSMPLEHLQSHIGEVCVGETLPRGR